MAVHNGIALYDIGEGGILTGVYANEQNPRPGRVFNEIAQPTNRPDSSSIVGTYECMYFEWGAHHHGRLDIALQAGKQNVYDVTWTLTGNTTPTFRGTGYILKPHVFAVHYHT